MQLTIAPKLVMFDLDGTLADTVMQLYIAVSAVLVKMNCPSVTVDDVRRYVGNGANVLLARSLLHDINARVDDVEPSLMLEAKAEFTRVYATCSDCSSSIYDGVIDTLEFFKSKGIKMAIVSNKPDMFIKPMLEKARLLSYFDYTLGSEILEFKKPNPEPLLFVCEKLCVEPSKAIMVGDSDNDVLAAKNANILSIALTYGYNRGVDIRCSKPDYVFDNFIEIKQLISMCYTC